MNVGEVKAELLVADATVMQAAEIANGIARQSDEDISVLGLVVAIEEIPTVPAAMVPARFEQAGDLAAIVHQGTAGLQVGPLVKVVYDAQGEYSESLKGTDHSQEPVSGIFGGLDHMIKRTTELSEGRESLARGARNEAAALYAAAAAVREQLSEQDFTTIAEFVAAEAATRTAVARDELEPARAALKPLAEEVVAAATTTKGKSQEYAVRLG